MRPGALAVRVRVLHAHHHGVRDLARSRRSAVVAHVADDHGAVAEPELGAVILPDLHPLGEPERLAQPGDRLPHVRVDRARGSPCSAGWSDWPSQRQPTRFYTLAARRACWRNVWRNVATSSRWITSRKTRETASSPLKSCSNGVARQDEQERPLARDRGDGRRAAVDEALVAERLPRPRQPDADAPVAANQHLLDGAVHREVAGRRRRPFGEQRAPRRAPGVASPTSGSPRAPASRSRGTSPCDARTCCRAGRSTPARRTPGPHPRPAGRPPRRRARRRGARAGCAGAR